MLRFQRQLFFPEDWLYAFSHDGNMLKNSTAEVSPYDFYFGKDGKADLTHVGWAKVDGKWFYFDKRGCLKLGFIRDKGKIYYIDLGRGALTGYHVINGLLYQFDQSGAMIGTVKCNDGWVKKDGAWYYCKNGEFASYGTEKINGKTYFFEDGKLSGEGIHLDEGIYIDVNGVVVKNVWKKVDGNWYYFDNDGKKVTGWKTINGKLYKFKGDGRLAE